MESVPKATLLTSELILPAPKAMLRSALAVLAMPTATLALPTALLPTPTATDSSAASDLKPAAKLTTP